MSSEWQCRRCGSSERYANGRCKPCDRAQAAAYRAANPEKIKAHRAAYRAANPDKVKAKNAAYRADKEKAKAQNAAYYAANPEKMKARMAAYYAANSEKVNTRITGSRNRLKIRKSLARLFSFLDEMSKVTEK